MCAVELAIDEIERVAGYDIQRRNIGPLVAWTRGNLGAAARSIIGHGAPNIAIITGFFLHDAEPPNCETDGPPGAVMLASALHALRIPCRIATDSFSAPVVKATLAGAGLSKNTLLDIALLDSGADRGAQPICDVVRNWMSARPPISHVIAIERCGPGRDGRIRNARGVDISRYNAPLERLFQAGAWTTIGIGDLGNELGMGSLPYDLVLNSVPNGDSLWCHIGCDFPIVAGLSNWAAAALLGALGILRPDWMPFLLKHLHPDFAHRLLLSAVNDGGAVSIGRYDKIPRPRVEVDGVPWYEQSTIYSQIYQVCDRVPPSGIAITA